jgi:fatty acid desaturase
MKTARAALLLLSAAIVCCGLSGCLVVGYSSGSGWWVWPGSLVVTLLLFLAWFLSRR